MFVGEKDEILSEYNVPLKRIQDQGIPVQLIVPYHCPGCGFGLHDRHSRWGVFQLEIRYPDQPAAVRVALANGPYDLHLMNLFLQGNDRYSPIGRSEEQPLKNEAERLRELFGVKEQ